MQNNAARFDLTLLMNEDEKNIHGSLEYNASLFDRDHVQQMMEHFQNLLQAIVDDPNQLIRTLQMFPNSAYRDAVAHTPGQNIDVLKLFDDQVACIPDGPALYVENESLSYSKVYEQSISLAQRLSTIHIKPQRYVGLLFDGSPLVATAILGALRANTPYILLDSKSMKENGLKLLETAHIDGIITYKHLVALLPASTPNVLLLDDLAAAHEEVQQYGEPTHYDEDIVSISYEYPATFQYATCWQRQTINTLLNHFQLRQWGKEGYKWAIWPPYTSPLFSSQLLFSLVSGGAIKIVPNDVRLNGSAYCAWLTEHEIQAAYLPPSMLGDLLLWARNNKTSPLRLLITHGEQLSEQRSSELLHYWPDRHIVAGFGPFHNNHWTTLYAVQPASPPRRTPVLHLPVDGATYVLLDAYMQPVPQGVVGDLYVTSTSIKQSYLTIPEYMTARFAIDPHNPAGAPLYKTQYRARLLRNGSLELAGHEGQENSFEGMRLWLQETTFALLTHPDVRDAAVVQQDGPKETQQLVAYVSLAPTTNTQETLSGIRMSMEQMLPLYMQPAIYSVVDHLPLHNDGGINYQALPTITSAPSAATSSDSASPQSQLEQEIAEVWKQVLQIDEVGRNDTFFDRGGHSILLIRLQGELQSKLGKSISILDLFQYPTISQFASHFQNSQAQQNVEQAQVDQIRTRSEKQQEILQRQQIRNKERRRGHGTF